MMSSSINMILLIILINISLNICNRDHLDMLTSEVDLGELNDQTISTSSQSSLIKSIDINGDNELSEDEIRSYVTDAGVGSKFLDDNDEIKSAVQQVITTMDSNGDSNLTGQDIESYLYSFAEVLTPEDVRDWAEHAMLLPIDIVNKFSQHSITGYDFPELIADHGLLLESELGISKAVKTRIIRGIKMKLLGMGKVSNPPYPSSITVSPMEPLGCSNLIIRWNTSLLQDSSGSDSGSSSGNKKGSFPIHRAVVMRYMPESLLSPPYQYSPTTHYNPSGNSGSDSSGSSNEYVIPSQTRSLWRVVYSGSDDSFVDSGISSGSTVMYKIAFWNAVGRSDYLMFNGSTRGGDGCGNDDSDSGIGGRKSGNGSNLLFAITNNGVDVGSSDSSGSDDIINKSVSSSILSVLYTILQYTYHIITSLYSISQSFHLLFYIVGVIIPMIFPVYSMSVLYRVVNKVHEYKEWFEDLYYSNNNKSGSGGNGDGNNGSSSGGGGIVASINNLVRSNSGNGMNNSNTTSGSISGIGFRRVSSLRGLNSREVDLKKLMEKANTNTNVNAISGQNNSGSNNLNQPFNGINTATTNSSGGGGNLCLYCGAKYGMGVKMGGKHNCVCHNTFHDKCGFHLSHWAGCKRSGYSGCRCLVCLGNNTNGSNSNSTSGNIGGNDTCSGCQSSLSKVVNVRIDGSRWWLSDTELNRVYRHRCKGRGCKKHFCDDASCHSSSGIIVGNHKHQRWWLCENCYCSVECRDSRIDKKSLSSLSPMKKLLKPPLPPLPPSPPPSSSSSSSSSSSLPSSPILSNNTNDIINTTI